MSLVVGRDGGVKEMEVHGLMTLNITEEQYGKIKLQLDNQDKKGMQIQVKR